MKTKPLLLSLFILLLAHLCYAQDFQVKSFTEVANDISAIRNEYTDINGKKCAIIKVLTNVDEALYDSGFGIEHQETKGAGQLWLWVSPGEKRLKVSKSGYIPLNYDIMEDIKPSTVYELTLSGTVFSNTLPVTIHLQPQNATLTVNGKNLQGASSSYKLPIGKNIVKISANGYQTLEQEIEVDESKVYFSFKLETEQDAALQITSNPQGAKILLDGVGLGTTPVGVFYKPGTYALRIVKDGYLDLEEEILVTVPQTQKQYTLKENVAYVTIKTHPNASVSINGNSISANERLKLQPQLVKIRVTMPKASPLEKQEILTLGADLIVEMYPTVETGTLQVGVSPFDAKIELSGDGGEFYIAKGMKIFNDIPVGRYTLKVYADGYQSMQKVFVLTADGRVTQNLQLKKGIVGSDVVSRDSQLEQRIVEEGTFTDSRDGEVYKVEQLGSQVWMAENLRYAEGLYITRNDDWKALEDNNDNPAYCFYNNKKKYTYTYGALYTYAAALYACPSGWHLPSDDEWTTLESILSGNSKGAQLANDTALWDDGDLTRASEFGASGFAGLPGAYRYRDGTFGNLGSSGYWWTSTETSASSASCCYLYYNVNFVYRYSYNKSHGYSVRCVLD